MKIIAITSCSTGIAHTYMAAEKLIIAAEEKKYQIKVETQGSIGAENVLTKDDIDKADFVIIAASTSVNKDRFIGKRLISVDVNEAIQNPDALIEKAIKAPIYQAKLSNIEISNDTNSPTKPTSKKTLQGIYAHLMTGVSYMIPFVVAGGLCIAISFALGGINAEGELAASVMSFGQITMGLMWPILGGYVAFSIADRPGLVPGMLAGMMASTMNAGFLGALAGGFLAGYTILLLKRTIKLPTVFAGLLPILILPIISVLVVGLLFKFVIGVPVTWINDSLTAWLNGLSGVNSIILGLILGAMMAIDLAGPIGKASYFFGVASLTSLGGASTVMAAVMVSGMVPPLAMALSSTVLRKDLYSKDEVEAGKSAWVLGLSFISEGAIPFAVADPVRVLASVTIGAAIAGGLSMFFNCAIAVPHGGFFVFLIPGAVINVLQYIFALAIGTLVSGTLISFLKIKRG